MDLILKEPEPVGITPAKRLAGTVCLPGDKSISHRAAILASLADGCSMLENFSTAKDCEATVACLQELGLNINHSNSTLTIEGRRGMFKQPQQVLDAANSGTTMRLLAGVLAGQPFESTITGDDSLLSRPTNRVAEPLRLMGAKIETTSAGTAPLRILGSGALIGIDYRPPLASAQIKSAILLAGLFADGRTTVVEQIPTRDHTELMLGEFGAEVTRNDQNISINGGARLTAQNISIPGDISSAAFFVAAACLLEGSDLTIRDVGLNPTRTAYLDILKEMGAEICATVERVEAGEPFGTVRVRGRSLQESRVLISASIIPKVIDELPLLAVVAAASGTSLEVRDAAELRTKESDRIRGTVNNLQLMGAEAEEFPDGFAISATNRLRGARLDSFGDHRVAMAFTVAALCAEGPSEIIGAECVAVSFPEFFQLLESLAQR